MLVLVLVRLCVESSPGPVIRKRIAEEGIRLREYQIDRSRELNFREVSCKSRSGEG